ncbi:Uncharacterised protein [Legionella busanensis]|uniref:Uncharacterized protein n=1 Tax=Legionella busanensis TaxID=190655 RepID=A0A378JKL3_9GAMM|nr:hypothetical protein [Legionella busanensis]STX50660.1 Uncharacterised protein [Legionella busanensis]
MHITLSLTSNELKLALTIETHRINPEWVVKWAVTHPALVFMSADGCFNLIQGTFVVKGENIKKFLEALITQGKDSEISTKSVSETSSGSSLSIQSIEHAKYLHSVLKAIPLGNSFTPEQFNKLVKICALNSSENLDAKTRFNRVYSILYSPMQMSGTLFSPDLSRIINQELSATVNEAKIDSKSACRKVFVSLGWMDEKGELTNIAPREVVEAGNTPPAAPAA